MNGVLAQLGVGGAVIIVALWLVLKYKPWKNGNGHGNGGAILVRLEALEREVLSLRKNMHDNRDSIAGLLAERELRRLRGKD